MTDKIAAALVRGMNIHGNSLTVKHFAANSQEYSRRDVNAVVSERALREIYLKSFEMCVKEGNAKTIMPSATLRASSAVTSLMEAKAGTLISWNVSSAVELRFIPL